MAEGEERPRFQRNDAPEAGANGEQGYQRRSYGSGYQQRGYNNRQDNYQQGPRSPYYNRQQWRQDQNSEQTEGSAESPMAAEGQQQYQRPYQQRPYQQRQGGYNNNRQGYNNNRQGGYNNRYNNNGGYNNRYNNGGYNNNYNNAQGGYRQQAEGYDGQQAEGAEGQQPRQYQRPYQQRQGGYNNNRQGGYNNNRQGGYNNRQGGYNNNRYNNNGQGGYNNRQNKGYGKGKSFTPRPRAVEYEITIPDPNETVRLNKFMANSGVCSRREADEFIQQGLVKVNGQVVTELGTKIKHSDVVEYDEKVVALERKCYILLNKPKDCVTTSDDPNGRLTVLDLVKGACKERIYPVGRLDRNTTGVLLLTNDGDLASKLTHPKYTKKKIYHVWTDRDIAEEDMQRIADGIELDDGEIHADAISYATETDRNQAGIEI
ncbi:MAG: rRNA pseudouridine synthase, partial [Muribaculaceae bacterium]|nr:rRNA pseudouridine synthase [Muribaculaceae bacterium]